MRGYDDYRKILELWEEGYNKNLIAKMTGIPRSTVRDCINRFRSVAELDEFLKQDPRLGRGEVYKYEAAYNPAIIKGYRPGKRRYTDEELAEAIKSSVSYAQVLEKLGVRPAGGNYVTLKQRIADANIDTSHFRGQGWIKGRRHPNPARRSLQEILVKNSTYTDTPKLKKRLLAEGYFEHRCLSCGLAEWLGQAIPLELDHINGDRRDHRLENLRLLCPNCHALTPTYRGKNINV